jgi:hypothetical protein
VSSLPDRWTDAVPGRFQKSAAGGMLGAPIRLFSGESEDF